MSVLCYHRDKFHNAMHEIEECLKNGLKWHVNDLLDMEAIEKTYREHTEECYDHWASWVLFAMKEEKIIMDTVKRGGKEDIPTITMAVCVFNVLVRDYRLKD